jgi:predicted nucleic acid-binding Zn ribbon protein
MGDVPQAWWDDPDGYGKHRKKPPGKYSWDIDAGTNAEHQKVMEEVEQRLNLLGCTTCGGKHTVKSRFSDQLNVPCPECQNQRRRILDEAVEKGQLKIVKLLTGNPNAVRYARVKKETVNA